MYASCPLTSLKVKRVILLLRLLYKYFIFYIGFITFEYFQYIAFPFCVNYSIPTGIYKERVEHYATGETPRANMFKAGTE